VLAATSDWGHCGTPKKGMHCVPFELMDCLMNTCGTECQDEFSQHITYTKETQCMSFRNFMSMMKICGKKCERAKAVWHRNNDGFIRKAVKGCISFFTSVFIHAGREATRTLTENMKVGKAVRKEKAEKTVRKEKDIRVRSFERVTWVDGNKKTEILYKWKDENGKIHYSDRHPKTVQPQKKRMAPKTFCPRKKKIQTNPDWENIMKVMKSDS